MYGLTRPSLASPVDELAQRLSALRAEAAASGVLNLEAAADSFIEATLPIPSGRDADPENWKVRKGSGDFGMHE